jgi:hypothetical protein
MYTKRTDYERALYLIKETQIQIPYGSRLGDSLTKQRYLPNGRMNLTLVDESMRATMHIFAGRAFEEMKNKTTEKED